MRSLRLTAFLLVLACSSWCQSLDIEVRVDLGWLTFVQHHDGWLVTYTPTVSGWNTERELRTDDLITRIDGHQAEKLGPLALAAMLDDVPFRSVPMTIQRGGAVVDIWVFGQGVYTDGTVRAAPGYLRDKLQERNGPAPQFALPDLQGRVHTLKQYEGKWLLLNIWGTWCPGCRDELPALNYLGEKHRNALSVLGIAMKDDPQTLTKFLNRYPLSYTVLLGGSFEDDLSRAYNLHRAPANILISPAGQVLFVGVGARSLKGAVETIARASAKQ